MMPEWGDDHGTRGEVWIRCVKCGWAGWTRTLTQYGATSWSVEECPECGMEVEGADDGD